MKFKSTPISNIYGIPVTDSRGKMVKRPMLELELLDKDGKKLFGSLGLIDSGADTTMLNMQYALALGVDFANVSDKKVRGIGPGEVRTKPGMVKFRVTKLSEVIELPVWFIDSPNVDILLGREVFFEIFRVKFEMDHDTFEVIKSHRAS